MQINMKTVLVLMLIATVVSVRFWGSQDVIAYLGLSQPLLGPISPMDIKDTAAIAFGVIAIKEGGRLRKK